MDDLRVPIGLFFAILGAILEVVAVTGSPRAPMTTININLYAGLCMLVFGAVMLWLARRSKA